MHRRETGAVIPLIDLTGVKPPLDRNRSRTGSESKLDNYNTLPLSRIDIVDTARNKHLQLWSVE